MRCSSVGLPASADVRRASAGVGGGAGSGGCDGDTEEISSHSPIPLRAGDRECGRCASSSAFSLVASGSATGVVCGAAGKPGEAATGVGEKPLNHRVGVCCDAVFALVFATAAVASPCDKGGDGVSLRRAGDWERRSSSAFTTTASCSCVRSSSAWARCMTLSHLEENSRSEGERE